MPYKPLATDESWQPVFCNITEQSRRTGRDDGWCNEIMPHSACAEDMNGNALCRCLPGYVHSRLGDDCYREINKHKHIYTYTHTRDGNGSGGPAGQVRLGRVGSGRVGSGRVGSGRVQE